MEETSRAEVRKSHRKDVDRSSFDVSEDGPTDALDEWSGGPRSLGPSCGILCQTGKESERDEFGEITGGSRPLRSVRVGKHREREGGRTVCTGTKRVSRVPLGHTNGYGKGTGHRRRRKSGKRWEWKWVD